MPITKGAVPLNAAMPFHEIANISNSATAIPNGGSADIEVGRYTMPFNGFLSCRLEWTVSFTGYQQFTIENVGFTSPAPNHYLQQTNLDGSPGYDYLVARNQLAWESLTAGQLVIVNLRFYVGGGGAGVSTDWQSVTFRATRLT